METEKGMDKNNSSNMDYMVSRLPVFRALATLELDNSEIREDVKTLSYLNQLGLKWNSLEQMEREWKRIKFVADNAYGNVLEIGCAAGNVTKYICKNDNVTSVLALDILPKYVNFLKQLNLNKVNASVKNLITEPLGINYKIDCVVMAELIEHITTSDEISILKHIQNNLNNKSIFIITTPIGFMEDPNHVRGFSQIVCVLHCLLFYGKIIKKANNGVQQFYFVQYCNRSFIWKLYKFTEENTLIHGFIPKLYKFRKITVVRSFYFRLSNFIMNGLKLFPKLRWKIAQKGEKKWWENWFKEHQNDNTWLKMALDYFNLKENQAFDDKVLVDIGGGPIGILTKLRAKERIVVDPLPMESVDKTIKRIKAPGERIPLPDETVDCVFIYNVLQHVMSPEKVLKEGTRILKKGGIFYLAEQLNVPTDKLHPHSLKLEMFEKWISENSFEIVKKIKKANHLLASPQPGSGYSMLCLLLRRKGEKC